MTNNKDNNNQSTNNNGRCHYDPGNGIVPIPGDRAFSTTRIQTITTHYRLSLHGSTIDISITNNKGRCHFDMKHEEARKDEEAPSEYPARMTA